MPGPLWKHTVRNMDSQLENCRQQIDRLNTEEGEVTKNGTFRKEIFNNANTVVEVAIKTKRHPSGEKKKQPTVTVNKARKVVHHRRSAAVTSSTASSSAENESGAKWSKMLSDSNNHTSSHVDRKSKLESKRFIQGTKSSRTKSRHQPEEKTEDEVDAIHGRFQNRTLQVFLHEMRAAIQTEASTKSDKIRKILDDLEYVASNMKGEKVEVKPKKKESPMKRLLSTIEEKQSSSKSLRTSDLNKYLNEAKEALKESELANQEKDQKIAELKEIVARLTTNNNDMLTLLTQKVGLEDSLKMAKKSNEELLHRLSLESKKNENLSNKADNSEEEIRRLRKVISDLQQSLHSDLERVSSRPATQTGFRPPLAKKLDQNSTVDLCLSEIEEPTRAKKGEKNDNADSAIHSESHPMTSASTSAASSNKQKALLEEAKKLLDRQETPTKEPANVFVAANLSLSETRDSMAEASGDSLVEQTLDETDFGKEKKKSVKAKRDFVAPKPADMGGNVHAFLDRMRNQAELNLTLPKLPTAKSFDGGATTLQITGINNSQEDFAGTLSESKFRKGLESSVLFTSDNDFS